MKRIYTAILVTVSALLICGNASAQSFRTGYFLDNYTYSYRLNPAKVTGESFFGLALDNIDLQNSSSLGISSFLYPKGNSLVTGLNSSVDANTFLGKLSDVNTINLDESINILTLGFGREDHTSTVEVNVRTTAGISLPYELFAFLKKGGQNTSYNIGGIYANVSAIGDIAYGYSRKINDQLSVGGRIHALIGLGNLSLNGNDTSVSIGDQEVAINSDIDVTSAGLLKLGISDGAINLDDTGLSTETIFGGFGATLDLGVIYKPIDGLEVSFSINDLGGISWKNNVTAKASGKSSYKGGTITFEGGNVSTDLEDALTELTRSINVKDLGETSSFAMMPMTIAAGARYTMPFYSGLSAGLLATYHTGKYTSWYDVRVGATITPAKIISATANLGMTTFGPTFGAALNACLGPVDLILGLDSFIGKMGKLSKFTVPLDKFTENIHLGLAFSF